MFEVRAGVSSEDTDSARGRSCACSPYAVIPKCVLGSRQCAFYDFLKAGDGRVVRRGPDLLALDAALERLAKLDPRKSKLVELRFFGGLSVEETAAILKVSPFTVIRDWTFAKVWLHREMSAE